ncbi:MAG: putative flap endonuclease-1-like 5' DNA nuclease [Yoonia sp.]|jgi:predicted flap endonuclease-1-like 5' DNA nuclease
MKDTGPISQGIIAVAALIAIIGAGVAFVLYDFSLFASVVIGVVIGVIAAFALAYGLREPQADPQAAPAPTAKPAAAARPAAAKPAVVPKAKTDAPKSKTASPKVKATATKGKGTPEFLSAPRDGGPDDLKKIKGVGPKLEQTLHGMGLYHFDQIASWGPKEQAWVDENLAGFKGRATRDDWVNQAKTLAAGGATAFSKKVKKGDVY